MRKNMQGKLNRDEKMLYRIFKKNSPRMTDLTFARIHLRAEARNWTEADGESPEIQHRRDLALARAAVLFVTEALAVALAADKQSANLGDGPVEYCAALLNQLEHLP